MKKSGLIDKESKFLHIKNCSSKTEKSYLHPSICYLIPQAEIILKMKCRSYHSVTDEN